MPMHTPLMTLARGMAEHPNDVAERSAHFADVSGAHELGYWLGSWHDLGKFSSDFQRYLRGHAGSVDHKRVGARLTQDAGLFALAIQGHHGGLRRTADFLNWLNDPDRTNVSRETETFHLARREMPKLSPQESPWLPAEVTTHDEPRLASEFTLWLLFSALVDANHLDTKVHFEPDRAERRGTTLRCQRSGFEARHTKSDGQVAQAGPGQLADGESGHKRTRKGV